VPQRDVALHNRREFAMSSLTGVRPLILTAVVLPIVTLTTAALATDDKTYPGAMCQPLNAISSFADMPALAGNGSKLNFSRNEQTWICPAVKDHMDTDPGFARITVQQTGIDEEQKVKCQFVAMDPLGKETLKAGGTQTKIDPISSNPVVFRVVYTFGDGDGDALEDVPHHGYYFFSCVVPGKTDANGLSGVVTYKVGEND
jgi:hypothetical protein